MDLSIIADIEAERDQLRRELAAAKAERDEAIREISRLGRELGACQHERDDLANELHRVNAMCSKLRLDLDKANAEVAHWRVNAANKVSKALYDDVCTTVDKLRRENDTLRAAAQRVVDVLQYVSMDEFNNEEIDAYDALKEALK